MTPSPIPQAAILNPDEVPVCDRCGGQDMWQSWGGGWHCSRCDPPVVADRVRRRVEYLRRKYRRMGIPVNQ